MPRSLASLAAVLLVAAPAFVAEPPEAEKPKPKPTDPPGWTFQVRSVGDLLAALRPLDAAYRDKPDATDTWIEETFGVAGLKGLDKERPVVGMVRPGEGKDDGSVVVLAVPVTKDADFLDLLDRADADPRAVKKHPGVTEFTWHGDTCFVRFEKKYAYVAVNGTPADLDPKAVPDPTAFDRTESGVAAVTLHPARLDDTLKEKLLAWPAGLSNYVTSGYVEAVPVELLPAFERLTRLAAAVELKRWVEQAEAVTVRFAPTKDGRGLAVEAVVKPKKGTDLEKLAAKPTESTNAFAALRDTPDVVELALVRWPDHSAAVADEAAALKKQGPPAEVWGEAFRKSLGELYQGVLSGTEKGSVDCVRMTTGPDKGDHFTTLYAATVPDTAKLGKAVLALLKDPPAALGTADDVAKAVKEPADKVGDNPIYSLPAAGLLDEAGREKYGKDAPTAFTWANGVVAVAVGPDAIAVVKRAVEASAKPGPAERVEVRAHPKKADEFHRRGVGGCPAVLGTYGTGDEVADMLRVEVSTDGGLRVRLDIRHDWLRYQNAWGRLDGLLNAGGWPW